MLAFTVGTFNLQSLVTSGGRLLLVLVARVHYVQLLQMWLQCCCCRELSRTADACLTRCSASYPHTSPPCKTHQMRNSGSHLLHSYILFPSFSLLCNMYEMRMPCLHPACHRPTSERNGQWCTLARNGVVPSHSSSMASGSF
jgi:hypothetical protein